MVERIGSSFSARTPYRISPEGAIGADEGATSLVAPDSSDR
jgi:hypothetical protein